jgi:hypothetical protein
MFGTIHSKIRGMRHVWVQYVAGAPKPEEIKLYEPFNNRECLHCHVGARKFEEATAHHRTPDLLDSVKSGKRSCMSNGCHDTIHDVGSLKDAPVWKAAK